MNQIILDYPIDAAPQFSLETYPIFTQFCISKQK